MSSPPPSRLLRLVLGLALGLGIGCALAHDGPRGGHGPERHGQDWEDDGHSHDHARRARERGEILTLSEVYARAAAQVPGRVLEAELEERHGRWVYELEILDSRGGLRELELDARTGLVLNQAGDD